MNREEARRILSAARPEDCSPPEVQAALRFAEQDPELRTWWQAEQAIDQAIQRKLRGAASPPDLTRDIVAGWRQTSGGSRRKRTGALLALAAAIVLLVGLAGFLWWRPVADGGELIAFRTDMARFLKVFPTLDIYVERHAEVSNWLTNSALFAEARVPASLQKFPAIGCRQLQWQGKQVALVCLMVDGEVVHLFVLAGRHSAHAASQPQFARARQLSTATWSSGQHTYVAMTPGGRGFLRKHL